MAWGDDDVKMMNRTPSLVVVIRAWAEEETVRGRITLEGDDGGAETRVASSTEELCSLTCAALEEWASRR